MSKNHTKSTGVFFPRKLLKSKAYFNLNASSMIVLAHFYMRRVMVKTKGKSGGWVVENNGEITFTYKEALSMGFTRTRFVKAIDQLIEHGFIDLIHQGGAMAKDHNLYSISDRWERYGKDDFKVIKRDKGVVKNTCYKDNFKKHKS